jgi:hypothetical protein
VSSLNEFLGICLCSLRGICIFPFQFSIFLFSFVQVMLACGKYNLVYEFFNKVEKSLIPGALNYKGNTCNLA